MDEQISRALQDLIGRIYGPMAFRLLLQPVIAGLLAIRAGLRDARANRAPYFWALLYDPAHRRQMLRQGWKDVSRIFALALVLDALYQWILFRWFYPGEALVVAVVLAVIPYVLIRGPVTRITRALHTKSR